MIKENNILLYEDENGKTSINVRFAEEDIWITQTQLAEIYQTTQQNISLHINNIYKEGELPKDATHKEFLLVQREGNRQVKRNTAHYNRSPIHPSYSTLIAWLGRAAERVILQNKKELKRFQRAARTRD